MSTLVGKYAAAAQQHAAKRVGSSTREKYGPEVTVFARYAASNNIPEDIFDTSQFRLSDMCQVLLYYAEFCRQEITGNTYDYYGRKMDLLSTTISNKISAIIYWIESNDLSLGASLRQWRNNPSELTSVLSGMRKEDLTLRGPKDSYCKIPAGIQFVEAAIRRIIDTLPNDIVEIYCVAILFEFIFGTRTYETLVKTGVAHIEGCHPINDNTVLTNPTMAELERTASVHSVRLHDIQLHWIERNLTLTADEGHKMPNDTPPDAVTLFGTSKNNQQGFANPSTIMSNPHLPGSSQFCLVLGLWNMIINNQQRNRASNDFLFAGVHDHLLRDIVKKTAVDVHIEPSRMHLSSLRIGCESATTPDIFDNTAEIMGQLAR